MLRKCPTYKRTTRTYRKKQRIPTEVSYHEVLKFPKEEEKEFKQFVKRIDIIREELENQGEGKNRKKIEEIVEKVNAFIKECNQKYLSFEASIETGGDSAVSIISHLYLRGDQLCVLYRWHETEGGLHNCQVARKTDAYNMPLDKVVEIRIDYTGKKATLVIKGGNCCKFEWSNTLGMEGEDARINAFNAIMFNEAKTPKNRCKGIRKILELTDGFKFQMKNLNEVVEILESNAQMRPLAKQMKQELDDYEAEAERERERKARGEKNPEVREPFSPPSPWKPAPNKPSHWVKPHPWLGDPPPSERKKWVNWKHKTVWENGMRVQYAIGSDGTMIRKVLGEVR